MIDRVEHLSCRSVSRETCDKLVAYEHRLREATQDQNLIAPSTWDSIWDRHILDSAQLIRFETSPTTWCDIGSGAGLPGVVIAILTAQPVTLLEPRRLRADFLRKLKSDLVLSNLTIEQAKPTSLASVFGAITARAVAPAAKLFAMAHHLSRPGTIWILPKGRGAQKELEEVHTAWHGDFRLEQSQTDASAFILIASNVRPRGRR